MEQEHQHPPEFRHEPRRDGRLRPSTRAKLGEHNAPPFLPFAQGNFPTPSGKAEFYSEALKRQGLDPVVAFTPPDESRHGSKGGRFPARTSGPQARQPSQLVIRQRPIRSRDWNRAWAISKCMPTDAEARGVRDGDRVRAFNSRGEIVLRGSRQRSRIDVSASWSGCRPARLGTFQPRSAAISMCSPQKNLPTWATRRHSIPSVLRWNFFGRDSGEKLASGLDGSHSLPYNYRFPNSSFSR